MSQKFIYVKENAIMTNPDEMIRFLDENGKLTAEGKKHQKDIEAALTKEMLIEAYTFMTKSRKQDEYMTQLQRQGRMLTFAPNFGEEALQVATSMAMDRKVDWFVPAFRSNATMLHLGVPMINQMLYWNGSEAGSRIPEGVNVTPIAIVIGAQYSHAAGIAYGMKLRTLQDKSVKQGVAVTIVGNGGTSEGETYEAMNMAAVQEWPIVFTVNNNQWAISTPVKNTTKVAISAKAYASGMPGLRVDGNDFLASYLVSKEAVEYARENCKPVYLEYVTWRQGVHTSSDNPRIYRTEAEEKEHEIWEPFKRLRNYMIDRGFWSEEQDAKLAEETLEEVKATYNRSLELLDQEGIDEVFDYTFATLPPHLKKQKEYARQYAEKAGK